MVLSWFKREAGAYQTNEKLTGTKWPLFKIEKDYSGCWRVYKAVADGYRLWRPMEDTRFRDGTIRAYDDFNINNNSFSTLTYAKMAIQAYVNQ